MQIAGSVLYLLAYGCYVLPEDAQDAMRVVCGDILVMYEVEQTTSRFTTWISICL